MKKGSIISGILTISIIITSTVIVVSMIKPVIDETAAYQTFVQAKQMMNVVDSVISELSMEASGASRTIELRPTGGKFIVSEKDDTIKFQLDEPVSGFEPGTRVEEGNLIITYGPMVKAYSNATDLVLENDAVKFAIRKLGNSTNYAYINTTNIISLMRNKLSDTDINPKSGIYINTLDNSSYGTGYTELTKTGNYLTSSGIRLVMNSSAGIRYEAIFTLSGAHDFVELQIRHIS